MSLTGLIKGKGKSGFGWSTTAEEVVDGLDLSGKSILITGCNSGLGFETMRVLAEHGATVLGAARSREKAEEAGAQVDGDVIAVVCELEDPESILKCVDEVKEIGRPLDALICNAGVMALPKLETVFGYEKQFFVNHVGHFILVSGLIEQMADEGRVVVVASDAHKFCPRGGIDFDNLKGEKNYRGWTAYGRAKLANILHARELARRFEKEGTNLRANAVHPGPINTNLTRNMNAAARLGWSTLSPLFLKSIAEGAATQTWAAVHPDTAELTGAYLADCNVGRSTRYGADEALAQRLWEETERIVEEVVGGVAIPRPEVETT